MRVDAAVDAPIEGRIMFYVGPLLIAESEISLHTTNKSLGATKRTKHDFLVETAAAPYRSIFVSYAHTDMAIVSELRNAFATVGDSVLRDTAILRSGETWSDKLLEHIEEADVFQLCWSRSAQESQEVEREWRHAVSLHKPNFVRPVYWEKPMPEPPAELADIHFSFYERPRVSP